MSSDSQLASFGQKSGQKGVYERETINYLSAFNTVKLLPQAVYVEKKTYRPIHTPVKLFGFLVMKHVFLRLYDHLYI